MNTLALHEKVYIGIYNSVVTSNSDGYFLLSNNGHNHGIYEQFGIQRHQLDNLLGYNHGGGFPYCKTLADLTKLVTFIKSFGNNPMNKTLSPTNAKRILDIACATWKTKLANLWGPNMVLDKDIIVSNEEYIEMRKACTPEQNTLFDEIFGNDIKHPKDQTLCLVSDSNYAWAVSYTHLTLPTKRIV